MKNKLIKLFVLAGIICSIMACGNTKKCADEKYGAMKGSTMVLNYNQLDSLCKSDTISIELKKWISSVYYDYETNNKTTKYIYIKHPNELSEVTYILVQKDTLYQIMKRTIVK